MGETAAPVVEEGLYLYRASGGCGCHVDPETDSELPNGGRPLQTPFGTFYATNLTPHDGEGVGRYSEEEFVRAMKQGVDRFGNNLFPTFPYTSFTKMRKEDVEAVWAYIKTLDPDPKADKAHDLPLQMLFRMGVTPWKWLFFDEGTFERDPNRSEQWNRGAYLVEAVGHCAECHSPRNIFGAIKEDYRFAGTPEGPEGDPVPNITPHAEGLADWSRRDLTYYLQTGMLPDGDFAGGLMSELIDLGYQYLTEEDREAIAVYLESLPSRNYQ